MTGNLYSRGEHIEHLRLDLEAVRKMVKDRFDQQTELIKSSFLSLSLEIQSLKKN